MEQAELFKGVVALIEDAPTPSPSRAHTSPDGDALGSVPGALAERRSRRAARASASTSLLADDGPRPAASTASCRASDTASCTRRDYGVRRRTLFISVDLPGQPSRLAGCRRRCSRARARHVAVPRPPSRPGEALLPRRRRALAPDAAATARPRRRVPALPSASRCPATPAIAQNLLCGHRDRHRAASSTKTPTPRPSRAASAPGRRRRRSPARGRARRLPRPAAWPTCTSRARVLAPHPAPSPAAASPTVLRLRRPTSCPGRRHPRRAATASSTWSAPSMGAEVCALPEGGRTCGHRVRGNLRSKCDLDVSGIAREMGGGGHRAAAGFTTTGTVDEVRAIVLPKLCALFDGDAALSSAPKADVRGASR